MKVKKKLNISDYYTTSFINNMSNINLQDQPFLKCKKCVVDNTTSKTRLTQKFPAKLFCTVMELLKNLDHYNNRLKM